MNTAKYTHLIGLFLVLLISLGVACTTRSASNNNGSVTKLPQNQRLVEQPSSVLATINTNNMGAVAHAIKLYSIDDPTDLFGTCQIVHADQSNAVGQVHTISGCSGRGDRFAVIEVLGQPSRTYNSYVPAPFYALVQISEGDMVGDGLEEYFVIDLVSEQIVHHGKGLAAYLINNNVFLISESGLPEVYSLQTKAVIDKSPIFRKLPSTTYTWVGVPSPSKGTGGIYLQVDNYKCTSTNCTLNFSDFYTVTVDSTNVKYEKLSK
jgi:hypothetical protein